MGSLFGDPGYGCGSPLGIGDGGIDHFMFFFRHPPQGTVGRQ